MPQPAVCAQEIKFAGGSWESPRFAIEEFQFYRLSFRSRTGSREYWVINFWDAAGELIIADNYSSIEPSGDWQETVSCVMARAGAVSATLSFTNSASGGIELADVSLEKVEPSEALAWVEATAAALPPVGAAEFPAAARGPLKATFERLKSGGTLRLLMLGDSIANDTSNSLFNLMVERDNPGCRVTLIHSMRGSTGCWFYQDDPALRSFVLRHKPDTVVIAGISHRYDPESILTVIRKTRAALPQAEFIVLAEHDPQPWRKGGIPIERKHGLYREFFEALKGMAESEGFAILDMGTEVRRYFDNCGVPQEHFMRDLIHYNDRGKVIRGRIFSQFFRAH